MVIPFVDLNAQYLTIKPEIDEAIAAVIRDSAYIRGPFVDEFERRYASVMNMPYCISCANGTDSIYISLKALGICSGDEVITTAHSWIATSETITQAGGRVVFVDTEYDTFTIDPDKIEVKITPRTKGIIAVHLYGQPANMPAIMNLANRYNLWVIEDCAQSHMARYDHQLVGTFGIASSFSFYPGKNLGAYGDAGCIITADPSLARQMTMFARHGGVQKGEHEIEGINSRLDGLQAAILNVKLSHLPEWTKERRRVAATYDRLLRGIGDILVPKVAPGREHVYHLYVIRTKMRDALMQWLKEKKITTVINYPVALPFLKAYAYLNHTPKDFPISYANQSEILSLPIFPELTEAMIGHIVDEIKAFFDR
jgi:dTDP-4-amino-4,6-dideoxygalactose transaminase